MATLKQAGAAADLAFLAMAQHQLGRKEQAWATLARLREALKRPDGVDEEVAHDFLREAEGLMAEK